MNNFKTLLIASCVFLLLSCHNDKNTSSQKTIQTETEKQLDSASYVLQETFKAHGGTLYDSAQYSFQFREKTYQFRNNGKTFRYESESLKDTIKTRDILENDVFIRYVNDVEVSLPEKKAASASGSINSVIYFATLPHKLNDVAVNKTYIGKTQIEGEPYYILKITFNESGGGEDFQDEYHYWIHEETKLIDYLAYNYQVNGGGARFRKAYNRRVVDGITFQDYINYKAPKETSLETFPQLYEQGKLEEVSRIETKNIINLKAN